MAYRLYYFGCCMLNASSYDDVIYTAYRWYKAARAYASNEEIIDSWRGSVYACSEDRILSLDSLIQGIYRVQHEDEHFINPRGRTVPRTGKMRGGGGYYRRMRTMNERRLNQYLDPEEGFIRPSRLHLPSSWDDYLRQHQRCWKKQRRGVKSWDR